MFKKGFSIIEIIITVGLTVLISSLILVSFNSLNNRQVLDSQVDFIKSTVGKIRTDALNSKNNSDQSITFSTTSIIYSNTTINLNSNVILSSYSTGTSTITFSRITGFPSATGTLIYIMKKGNTVIASSSLTINNLGIIE
jgi:Tfp pilus assembly protein FimT